MDKFGVLKLLSSLFDAYKLNNGQSLGTNSTSLDVESLLSPLKNLIANGYNQKQNSTATTTPTTTAKDAKINQNTKLLPLQNKMLSTMNSHDQFVKRVNENLNKNAALKH